MVNLLDKNTTEEAIQHLRKADKDFLNINNKLVRLSVGLEDVEDIIKDLDSALKKV